MLNPALLEEGLAVLGAALEARGMHFEIVAVGGGSLLLLGLISRATADLDVVALVESGQYVKPAALPVGLIEAVSATARVVGIREDWLNPGPAALMDLGLPNGFAGRTVMRQYGGLVVHLAGRRDQVFLKLFAAADQGPQSKHFQDLLELQADRPNCSMQRDGLRPTIRRPGSGANLSAR